MTEDRVRFRFNFFKLNVADLAGAVTFYSDVFGFEEQSRLDLPGVDEVMLAMPGESFMLVLLQFKDGRTLTLGDAHGPIGFLVRDIDAAVSQATARGAKLLRAPADTGFSRYAFLADPEGHEIELIQFTRRPA